MRSSLRAETRGSTTYLPNLRFRRFTRNRGGNLQPLARDLLPWAHFSRSSREKSDEGFKGFTAEHASYRSRTLVRHAPASAGGHPAGGGPKWASRCRRGATWRISDSRRERCHRLLRHSHVEGTAVELGDSHLLLRRRRRRSSRGGWAIRTNDRSRCRSG